MLLPMVASRLLLAYSFFFSDAEVRGRHTYCIGLNLDRERGHIIRIRLSAAACIPKRS